MTVGNRHRQHDPASYLSTDHLRGDLGRHSVRSSALTIAAQATQFVAALGSTMVLARLLTPSDFGLLAMVSVLTSLVKKFKDFGLPLAIMHEAEIDHMQISRLFWLNLKRNGLLALFMAAIAPLAAWFYNERNLIPIIMVITIGTFFVGLTKLHLGLLRRQMRFGVLAAMEVGSVLTGISTGIVLALQGAGYWSLVFQQLATFLTQAVFLWFACGWRPAKVSNTRLQSDSGIQSMLSYGRYTTFASLLSHVGSDLDRILLGGLAGSAQLGLYQSAQRWATFPIKSIYAPLKNVTLAGSSRLQDEPDRYRAYARTAFLTVFSAAMPVIALLYVEAHDFILLLLGPKWLEIIPIFRVLAIAALAECGRRMTVWVYLAEGQTKRQFTWTLISMPLTIAGVVAGAPWGVVGIATGYAGAVSLLVIPSMLFCLKTSRLRGRDLWAAIWRPVLASVLAAALLVAFQPGLAAFDDLPPRLLVHTSIFALSYLGLWIAAPGGVGRMREMIALVKAARNPAPTWQ